MGRLLFRVPSLLGLYGIPVVYVFASYVCFGVQPAEVLTSLYFHYTINIGICQELSPLILEKGENSFKSLPPKELERRGLPPPT